MQTTITQVFLREHTVYYRAVQVGLSAGCYKRPPLEVGDRVAILEDRGQVTQIPTPEFYEAIVERISDGAEPLVTFKYENHPHVTELSAGMNSISPYCVLLPKRRKKQKASTR